MKTNTNILPGKKMVRLLSTLLTLCLSYSVARSQWREGIVSGGTYNNPDNWTGGVINDQFVTASGSYGWTANYTVSVDGTDTNSTNRTFNGDFVYRNADNVDFNFAPTQWRTPVWTFNQPATNFIVEMGGAANAKTFTIGAPSRRFVFDFQNHDVVYNVDPGVAAIGNVSRDTLQLNVTQTNLHNLLKTGGGQLKLSSFDSSVTGTVTVLGGRIRIEPSVGNFNGTLTASRLDVLNQGSLMEIATSGAAPALSVPVVNLQAGGLSFHTSWDHTIDTLNLQGGRSLINNSYNSGPMTLTLTNFKRNNYATLNLTGRSDLGASSGVGNGNNFIKISNAADDLAVRNSMVGGLVPWVVAATHNRDNVDVAANSFWAGSEFVTYTTAGGFRMLTAAEYYTGALAGAGVQANVNLSAADTVSASQTINALKFSAGLTIAAGQTLTLSSGAMINVNDSASISGGTLDTGVNPLILSGRSNPTISSVITNSVTDPNAPGVIVANVGGGPNFTGNNTYGGMTLVQGNLRVGGAYALPSATELRIDRSGNATINAAANARQLSGIGKLIISNNNRLDLGVKDAAAGNRLLRVNSGGVLAPGDISGDYQAGTLLVDAIEVVFNAGSVFSVDLSAGAHDVLQSVTVGSALTFSGGTLALNFLGDYTPAVGDTWQLTEGFASASGDFNKFIVSDPLHADWQYTLSLLDNKNLVLTLNTIPEPATWALLLSGAALWFTLRRWR